MKPALKRTMIIGGAMALGGPLLGFIGTFIGMMSGFLNFGQAGPASSAALSSDISLTFLSTMGGIVMGIIGLMIFLIGLIMWLVAKNQVKPAPLNT